MSAYPATDERGRSPHPRTCCVYCGRRITGSAFALRQHIRPRDRITLLSRGVALESLTARLSARLTCADHLDLPALDPEYAEQV